MLSFVGSIVYWKTGRSKTFDTKAVSLYLKLQFACWPFSTNDAKRLAYLQSNGLYHAGCFINNVAGAII